MNVSLVTASSAQGVVYGVLAGQGRLPRLVVEALLAQNVPVTVVAFEGQTDPSTVVGCAHVWTRLGDVGKTLRHLKTSHVTHVILAGAILRPSLRSLRPDWQGMKLLRHMVGIVRGDNEVLSRVMQYLEAQGFAIKAAHDVLPELLAPQGPMTHCLPTAADLRDAQHAFTVAKALGQQDVGQGVVVQEGVVLAVEAAEGTDQMLERCVGVRQRLHGMAARGGVLVKVSKPGQDLRADLPTIGVQTLETAYRAGLQGLALEAGKTLIVDPQEVRCCADRLGLFVIGLSPTGAYDSINKTRGEGQKI